MGLCPLFICPAEPLLGKKAQNNKSDAVFVVYWGTAQFLVSGSVRCIQWQLVIRNQKRHRPIRGMWLKSKGKFSVIRILNCYRTFWSSGYYPRFLFRSSQFRISTSTPAVLAKVLYGWHSSGQMLWYYLRKTIAVFFHMIFNSSFKVTLSFGAIIRPLCIKRKVKLSMCFFFNWAPRHEGVLESGGIAPLILWPRHLMKVSGQLHAPVALLPGKRAPGTQ
jgi:hypothetical protein